MSGRHLPVNLSFCTIIIEKLEGKEKGEDGNKKVICMICQSVTK